MFEIVGVGIALFGSISKTDCRGLTNLVSKCSDGSIVEAWFI